MLTDIRASTNSYIASEAKKTFLAIQNSQDENGDQYFDLKLSVHLSVYYTCT
jgi:hypothetical protein